MSFTKWMESEFFLDMNETAKCMKSMLLHKVAQRLANAYINKKLPTGYSGYMKFGPKAKSGDWGDLAMTYPIIMFMMGIAAMVSIAGLSYCILLYLGFCGSKHSCERPFQRYWRMFLCLLILTLILLAIPSLWIAYNSSFYLMLTSLDVDKPPDVREMLTQSILQYNHVFQTNAEEFQNYALSESTELNSKITTNMGYDLGNKSHNFEKELLKKIESLKQMKPVVEIENEFAYVLLRIIKAKENARRIFRQIGKNSHTGASTLEKITQCKFNALLTKYTSVELVTSLNNSIIAFRKSLDLFEPRLKQFPAVNEVIQGYLVDTANMFLEKWRDFLGAQVQDIQNRGQKITTYLSETVRLPKGSSDEPSQINLPPSLAYLGLLNCIILTLILESLVVIVVIGIIGTRGPRDTFGLNKTTSSKLLVINIIVITVIFSVSALIACHHFFWATVIQNGVCNLVPSSGSERQAASNIFLACNVPETIYTKLLSEKLIKKISFNEDPVEFDQVMDEYVTKLKNTPTPIFDNASSTENIAKEAEKAINITNPKNVQWDYASEFSSCRQRIDYISSKSYQGISCYAYSYDHQVTTFARNYMKNYTSFMSEKMASLSRSLHGGSVEGHMKYFCEQIDKLYKDFNKDASYVKTQFKDIFVTNLRKYSKWVEKAMLEIGKCGLLAAQYQQSFKSSCNCLTDPLNAYWIGIFSVLLTMLPIIVAGIALANLLKKVCVDYTPKTER